MRLKQIFLIILIGIALIDCTSIFTRRADRVEGNWDYCAKSKDSIWYYDNKNITRPTKNIIRGWIKIVDKEKPNYSIQSVEIDCINKKDHLLSRTEYDKDGGVIIFYTPPPDKLEWDFIVPDSVRESIYEIICK